MISFKGHIEDYISDFGAYCQSNLKRTDLEKIEEGLFLFAGYIFF